jgi:type II secretory pathway pseudopilin PulG
MNLFTELHLVVMALLALLCLSIGYMWGRSIGMKAERAKRRRIRSIENAKSQLINPSTVDL